MFARCSLICPRRPRSSISPSAALFRSRATRPISRPLHDSWTLEVRYVGYNSDRYKHDTLLSPSPVQTVAKILRFRERTICRYSGNGSTNNIKARAATTTAAIITIITTWENNNDNDNDNNAKQHRKLLSYSYTDVDRLKRASLRLTFVVQERRSFVVIADPHVNESGWCYVIPRVLSVCQHFQWVHQSWITIVNTATSWHTLDVQNGWRVRKLKCPLCSGVGQ